MGSGFRLGSVRTAIMRNRILLAALLAAVLGAAAWLILHSRAPDPVFQGKPLSHWLVDFDRWDQANTNAPVVLAIRALGTNALPMVVRMSLWRDSSLKEKLGIEFEKHPRLMPYRYTIPAQRWQRAGQALSVMGEPARAAVPIYLRVLATGDVLTRRLALNALGSIGPPAEDSVPALLALFPHQSDEIVRGNLLGALGGIGRRAALCVPLLVQALGDTNVYVRKSAAYALGRFGGEASAAVPSLTRALQDKSMAREAAAALSRIQPGGQSGIDHDPIR
jgi:hypothetical protein